MIRSRAYLSSRFKLGCDLALVLAQAGHVMGTTGLPVGLH